MKIELDIKKILAIGLPILFLIILTIFIIFNFMKKNENFDNAKINLALNKANNAEKSIQNIQRTVQMQNDGCAPKYRRANDTSNSKPEDNKKIQVPAAASCNDNADYGRVPKKINKEYEKFSIGGQTNENEDKIIEVILVYADWCGYSRKAEPEFDKLLKEMNDTEYKGHKLEFEKLEEKKNEPEFKKMVSLANVRGFPTIVVRKSDQIQTFNSIELNDMKNKLKTTIDKNF
tara:strand:+ start:450 stop:1145 length:696 start_codon:yes stop_codon:yes gene_type:complete